MTNNKITSYTANDLMSTEVLSVYEGWSIQRLADFFLDHDITGAPVISSDHQLVGVVSVSDIFRFENADDSVKSEALRSCYRNATGIDIISRKDLVEWTKSAQKNCTVHQIMALQIIDVDVGLCLSDIAAVMVENDIHRVFVTQQHKIVGVITTTDVLRVLVLPENNAIQAKR
jgi:predicted transcriptional regulator